MRGKDRELDTPSKRSVLLWLEKSENTVSDYLQTTNMDFLDMFLTAKHLEGCSDKTIRYYRCSIEKMLDTINIPVIKITTEMLRKYLVEYQTINNCGKVLLIIFVEVFLHFFVVRGRGLYYKKPNEKNS